MPRAKKVEVGVSDDYATLTVGKLEFYFGYERTYCPKCGKDNLECEHESSEWCFTAKRAGKELMRIPQSKLVDEDSWPEMATALLAGIGKFLAKSGGR